MAEEPTTTKIIALDEDAALESAALDAWAHESGFMNWNHYTLTAALDAAPSGDLYPCPANWESIRARVLALFDALGPGDAVPLSLIDPSRFPSEEATAPGTLSLAALYDAVGNAQDVLAVTPLTPSADVIPDPMHQVTLAKFWIEEAP